MPSKYLYKIIFDEDFPDFLGGESIHNSKWVLIPNKAIKRLEYFLSPGEGIILEGFESYLCFVEARNTLFSSVGNCPRCGKKAKISQARVGDKKIFLARCKDMGTVSKEQVEKAGLDWNFFVNIIIKNKLGEIKNTNIWLTYSEKQLPIIKNVFNIEYKLIIKEAFDKSCRWVGKIEHLKNLQGEKNRDKFIYIMGLKKGMVTSYRVTLKGKDGEDKYQTGDITKRVIPLGQEDNGRPTNRSLWRRGIVSG